MPNPLATCARHSQADFAAAHSSMNRESVMERKMPYWKQPRIARGLAAACTGWHVRLSSVVHPPLPASRRSARATNARKTACGGPPGADLQAELEDDLAKRRAIFLSDAKLLKSRSSSTNKRSVCRGRGFALRSLASDKKNWPRRSRGHLPAPPEGPHRGARPQAVFRALSLLRIDGMLEAGMHHGRKPNVAASTSSAKPRAIRGCFQ